MKSPVLQFAVVAASFSAALVFAAPAPADPPSGTSTTVEMSMPGTGQVADGGDTAYQSPPVSMAVQDGTGGVDRDGTDGSVNPDGTDGRITGPLMVATPAIRAEAAPTSPRIRS